ncbi:hypothetical protein [Phenylobacterium sp.]|jgi:hypothetical protein|uniref:hypothetical protein n=1 Tax=Phenylobacterium sp. TaxID=1871053 RepID=UPI0037CA5ADB
MAKRPRINPDDLDRRVTDLNQYKKSRQQAERKVAPKARPGSGLMGSNPRAPLILAIVAIVLAALYVVPLFL